MLDLNHILLFIACVSPLVLLAQAWRRGGLNRAWRFAAFAVLLITGISWFVQPDTAGFVGGSVWLMLIVLPSIGLRKAAELSVGLHYASASRLVTALRFLHPANGLREQSDLLRALDFAQRGDSSSALSLLGSFGNKRTNIGRQAIAQSFRIREDWIGLLDWFHDQLPPGILQSDPSLQPLYLRALGEVGARDQLITEFVRNAQSTGSASLPLWVHEFSLLQLFAFGGRLEGVSKLFETKLRKLSSDAKEYWIGIAQIAAGQETAGESRLKNLQTATSDALIRADCTHRLKRMNEIAPTPFSQSNEALLRRIEQSDDSSPHLFAARGPRPTTVVLILIGLNLAMFVAESLLGGSTDPDTLHQLGALEFYQVWVAGEYWRLLTSLFLHYGMLHLLFNLYALLIVGPGLERAIGSIRFAICYLLAGLGSGIGVCFLRLYGFNNAEQLVGASGCVMGLVGVWAGLLLRHRHTPMAGRRLKNILVIVAVQTAFDLSTPQISMAAHLSGLITGLLLGLIFAPRSLPTRDL